MSGRFCLLFALAVFINFGNSKDEEWEVPQIGNRNEGNLKLRFIRATATNIYVEAICEPSCSGISWETKAYRFMFGTNVPSKVEHLGNNRYVVRNLYSHGDYVIEARLKGSFDQIRGRTCSDYLGPLEDLRSDHNGPGWLDIRWKPYFSYECRQDIEYEVRLKVEGGNFTEFKSYGWYPIDDKGNIHVGPSHPCDDWPKHFCLLLTENVIAGKKHIVEVVPKRLGGERRWDAGAPQTLVAFADPRNAQGAGDAGVHPQCQLWAWLAVGACLFCIAVIIGILVSSLVSTYEKTQKLREEAENAENDENKEIEEEETEETALTAETRQSEEMAETKRRKEKKEKSF